ncbi:MAG TPA: Calx-beta domain-containing protein, partial [Polyangiales bacterium]|nr:Calx-beta domain-containing protein [Polyangiales bacterium]
DGTDFWASADAPSGTPNQPASFVSGRAKLTQTQSFIKREENARLQLVVTDVLLEAIDSNGNAKRSECAPGFSSLTAVLTSECDLLRAEVSFSALAFDEDGPLLVSPADCERSPFSCRAALNSNALARIAGHAGLWRHVLGARGPSTPPAPRGIWDTRHFDFTADADGSSGAEHPRFNLREPLTIEADLSAVEVGQEFWVESVVDAFASNRRGDESGIGAYLRDPAKLRGASLSFTGLEATHRPAPPRPPPTGQAQPVPCANGPDPSAGALQLGAPSYALAEEPFSGMSAIEITRTGGSTGAVSVAITTSGGSAIPGVHYTPLTTTVYFADGDQTPRFLDLEVLLNDGAEPDTTVNITLSEPGGCAALGPQASAELTIMDDDRALAADPALTIGGTVTGLVGTGLVLHETTHGESITPGNGPFVFAQPRSSAVPAYAVEVRTHPTEPAQFCTVSHGSGVLAGASVSDVEVSCSTPAADGALDPSFGSEGKVTTAFGGTETAMALQTDGKIVMVGGSGGDFVLARYEANGDLDPGFGSAGLVTSDFGAPVNEQAHAVALQADGKILVAGFTVHGTTAAGRPNFDFTLVRYEGDGKVDTSFGSGGIVTTDFNAGADQAFAVAVQPDGRIVVAGNVGVDTPSGNPSFDFGLARYESDGRLDDSFGSGGKLTTDIGGGSEFARAIALQQPEGTILVSGRA